MECDHPLLEGGMSPKVARRVLGEKGGDQNEIHSAEDAAKACEKVIGDLRSAFRQSVSVLNAVKRLEVTSSQQAFLGSSGSLKEKEDHRNVVGVLNSFHDDLGSICSEMGDIVSSSGNRGTRPPAAASQSLNQNEVFSMLGNLQELNMILTRMFFLNHSKE
jgi:hypothetical protein